MSSIIFSTSILTAHLRTGCGQPTVPPNVSVVSTTEGDTVTLQCDNVVITCNNSGEWNPDPAELVCNTMPSTSESTCEIGNTSVMPGKLKNI